MRERKMKRYLAIALLLLSMGLITSLQAQLPEQHAQLPEQRPQIRLNMDDVLQSVDKFTLAYIQGVTERQTRGVFPLTLDDAKQMRDILERLVVALVSV